MGVVRCLGKSPTKIRFVLDAFPNHKFDMLEHTHDVYRMNAFLKLKIINNQGQMMIRLIIKWKVSNKEISE